MKERGLTAAADRVDEASAVSKQGKGPQARAAGCPPCVAFGIRKIARRAAPLAAAAAKKLLGKGNNARERVSAGARGAQRFVTYRRTHVEKREED